MPARPSEDEQPSVNEAETVLPQIIPEPEESEDKLQEMEEENGKTEDHQLKEVTPALPDHEAEEMNEKEETDAMDLVKTESIPPQDSEKKAIVEEELVPDITRKQEAPLDTTQSALELTQLFTDILVQYV